MDLKHPLALAALALLPLLWWLARPPSPRRMVATAHLPQWRAALERLRRAPVRFRRLRFWLLAAAFSAVVLAAAGPREADVAGPRALAILLDGSPSMLAREPDGSSAHALACARIVERLAALPEHIEVRLVWHVADGARIERGTPAEIAAFVARADTSMSRVDADHATIAAELDAAGVASWSLTDARGASHVPEHGACDVVGAPDLANRALTIFAVTDGWPLAAVRVEVEVATWPARDDFPGLSVGPGFDHDPPVVRPTGPGRWSVRIDLRRGSGGELVLALVADPTDALAADDRVAIRVPPPPATRIGVLRGEARATPSWVDRAAESLAELVGGEAGPVAPGDRVGLVLVDGGRFEVPSAGAWTFGTAFGDAPERPTPVVTGWDRAHWLTAGLDLSELVVRRAVGAGALPSGAALVWAADGPLLVVREDQAAGRSLHAAFRLEDSNLPLLAAFPQLLQRAMVWSAGRAAQPSWSAFPSSAESDLRRSGSIEARPLPEFGRDGRRWSVPLLLFAMLALAARMHAR